MKVGVYEHLTRRSVVSPHMDALTRGIAQHDDVCRFYNDVPLGCDVLAVWGWRKALWVKAAGFKGPILVVERGYIGDRIGKWTSLGWDGLNGKARHNPVWDQSRFCTHFSDSLKPWKYGTGYALLAGQVAGDMSLVDVNIHRWYEDTAKALVEAGWEVVFRQHPVEIERGRARPDLGDKVWYSTRSLEDDLAGAALVACYNSNTAVDAVMAGVPIYTADSGSMVYELSSKDFNPIRPPREKRLNEIANIQWQMDELASGKAWEVVKTAM